MTSSGQAAHVAELRAGSPAAWQRFMNEHGRIALAVGRRVGLDEADREELFQITCMIAFRSVDQLRDPTRLSSWVYSIAYRNAISLAKQRRIEISPDGAQSGNDDVFGRLAADEPAADEVLGRMEMSLHIREAVGKLGDPCHRLLDVMYLQNEEPSYEEVSDLLEMPIGSIGPTRARCLEKLRKVLAVVSGQGRLGTNEAVPPTAPSDES